MVTRRIWARIRIVPVCAGRVRRRYWRVRSVFSLGKIRRALEVWRSLEAVAPFCCALLHAVADVVIVGTYQVLALVVTLGAVHSSVGQRSKAKVLLAANDWKGEAVVTQSIRVAAHPEKEAAVTKRFEAPASKRYASSSEAANFVQPGAVLRRPVASGVTYVAEPTGAQAVSTAVGFKTEPSAAATGYGGGHGRGHGGGHGEYFQ